MAKRIRKLSCDFETTIGDKTNVWLWGAVDIETLDFEYGYSIESFIDFIHEEKSMAYFHNLKFDGMFLIDYYLRNEITPILPGEKLSDNTMKCIISDQGQFYNIDVSRETIVEYRDSLKLIPLPVEKIPKAFGLKAKKLSMDYTSHEYGLEYTPTDDDIDYVKADCTIVAMALSIMFKNGMDKLTLGSCALAWYKDNTPNYKKLFPELTPQEDMDIRRAYKGGWTYCNPVYQKQLISNGIVLDVNSMYPWAMRFNQLPYGKPLFFTGEYKPDNLYPLWVCCINIDIELKPGCFPSIQLKNNPRYIDTEYIVKTDGPTLLYVTNIDYQLIVDTYDIKSIDWICGYKFAASSSLFSYYVDHWYAEKEKDTELKNDGKRTIDKYMLNMLYGKFGSNPHKDIKLPYIEDDIVKFKRIEMPLKYNAYIPVATFITSYCRDKIIRAAISCGDRFLYADTDSLHIMGNDYPDIDIDEYRLGAFKVESKFTASMYYRSKLYIETIDGKDHKKAGGLPEKCRGPLTYETMHDGATFSGKLLPKTVPGGVVLVPHDYQIRG